MLNIAEKIKRKGLKKSFIAAKNKVINIQHLLLIPIRLRGLLLDSKNKLTDELDIYKIRKKTLDYVENMRVKKTAYGKYRYCESHKKSVLYSSIYAVLIRHLYRDLENITKKEKEEWVNYIQLFQEDDGLFKDPTIANEISDNSDWWGWRHLTLHALMALACLGATAKKKLNIAYPFKNRNYIAKWLESLDWTIDPATTSNKIQNYFVMLQYIRDFHEEKWAGESLLEAYRWLDNNQDNNTGLWGNKFDSAYHLSQGVQTGYHIWLLYFYDKRPIKCKDKIIDSCLSTRNKIGGFGVLLNSSACEDIDSIDPLNRLYFLTDYRKKDIRLAIKRSIPWIISNMNKDGGFVFRRFEPFFYGHNLMSSKMDESAMFPTWFRTLSLAYISKMIPGCLGGKYNWQFIRCPGMQFW